MQALSSGTSTKTCSVADRAKTADTFPSRSIRPYRMPDHARTDNIVFRAPTSLFGCRPAPSAVLPDSATHVGLVSPTSCLRPLRSRTSNRQPLDESTCVPKLPNVWDILHERTIRIGSFRARRMQFRGVDEQAQAIVAGTTTASPLSGIQHPSDSCLLSMKQQFSTGIPCISMSISFPISVKPAVGLGVCLNSRQRGCAFLESASSKEVVSPCFYPGTAP
jgi:hypothetical protein